MKKFLLILFFLVGSFCLLSSVVLADECNPSCSGIDECQRKIDECTKLLQMSVNATKPHEEKMAELQKDIDAIESNINQLEKQIAIKKAEIDKDEGKLTQRQQVLDSRVRDFYKKDWQSGLEYMLVTFFSTDNVGEALSQLAYRQNLIDREKKNITSLVLEISDLAGAKKKLEETQSWLADKRASLEVTLAPIKKLVNEARAYQNQLSQTVGQLSARQQELLAEKTGGVFSASVGNVAPSDDPNARPDFDPGFHPAFAGFSFGIPHRYGMSQYGAFGRAKAGGDAGQAENILKAYYSGIDINKNYSLPGSINVCGYGNVDFNSYMNGIGEMPNSWGDQGGYEALKAQAIAARSYALAVAASGRCIQPTEGDQVYLGYDKGGNWDRAVSDTRTWVAVSGGSPIWAFYSASDGGFTLTNGNHSYLQSIRDVPSGGSWPGDAYENTKYANSPFFYVGCYRPRCLKSYSASRSSPWLTQDEFVDIVNSVLLYLKDNSTLVHLSQTDKSNSDTWSRDQVRSALGGDAISSVESISPTSYNGGGYTDAVHLQTDKGQRDIRGSDFRLVFNTRAPGEIWLASSLFNIEKK